MTSTGPSPPGHFRPPRDTIPTTPNRTGLGQGSGRAGDTVAVTGFVPGTGPPTPLRPCCCPCCTTVFREPINQGRPADCRGPQTGACGHARHKLRLGWQAGGHSAASSRSPAQPDSARPTSPPYIQISARTQRDSRDEAVVAPRTRRPQGSVTCPAHCVPHNRPYWGDLKFKEISAGPQCRPTWSTRFSPGPAAQGDGAKPTCPAPETEPRPASCPTHGLLPALAESNHTLVRTCGERRGPGRPDPSEAEPAGPERCPPPSPRGLGALPSL